MLQAQECYLVSLFQNLISNNIRYRGLEPPRIRVSVQETDGMFQFAVADNGVGIGPEYHSKIFVAFKRLTGVGLAICQRAVERYGGRIWVESESNGKNYL